MQTDWVNLKKRPKVFENGKQLLDEDDTYTFEDDDGWVKFEVKNNGDQSETDSELFVIVTIKTWHLTHK